MAKKWLGKWRKNDERVEKEIFEKYYERVYYSAYFLIKDRELAQDIVQETFIKAFKHLHTVDEEQKLGAWLSTIASRTAIDYIRKEKKWNEIVTDDVYIGEQTLQENEIASTVENELIQKQTYEQVGELINRLKPEYKQAIILRYLYELSYEEMATYLDMNVSTIKTRTHRAKKQLKTIFEKGGMNDE